MDGVKFPSCTPTCEPDRDVHSLECYRVWDRQPAKKEVSPTELHDFLKKEFEWQRHLLYQILIDGAKQMATVQEVKDKVTKVSTDLDAFIAAHPPSVATAADLDDINTALDAVDAKLQP